MKSSVRPPGCKLASRSLWPLTGRRAPEARSLEAAPSLDEAVGSRSPDEGGCQPPKQCGTTQALVLRYLRSFFAPEAHREGQYFTPACIPRISFLTSSRPGWRLPTRPQEAQKLVGGRVPRAANMPTWPRRPFGAIQRQPPERGEFDAPMAPCHLFGRDSLGTSAAGSTRLLPGRSARGAPQPHEAPRDRGPRRAGRPPANGGTGRVG